MAKAERPLQRIEHDTDRYFYAFDPVDLNKLLR